MKKLLFLTDSLTENVRHYLKLSIASFKFHCLLLALVMASGVGRVNAQCPNDNLNVASLYCEPDCEHNANLSISLMGPGVYFVRFTYNNTLMQFYSSNEFNVLAPNGNLTTVESIVPIGECAPGIPSTNCISGSFINWPNLAQIIQVSFFDFDNPNILIGTRILRIDNVRTVSGTVNLSTLIANQTLLNANTARTYHQNILLDVNSTLVINEDYFFNEGINPLRGRSHIMPLAGSGIRVESGVTLTINGALLGGCNPWHGIELMPGAKLLINEIGVRANTSIIDWAENGILMHEGSEAFVVKTQFKRNLNGINAPPETPPITRQLSVIGSIFDGMNRSNSVGMRVYNLPYTIIASILGVEILNLAQFTRLNYGVISYNSTLDFYVPWFNNIVTYGIKSSDYNGIRSNANLRINNYLNSFKFLFTNFEKMPTAIYSLNTELNVLGANIKDVNIGINFGSESGRNALIEGCEIKSYINCVSVNGRNGSQGDIVNSQLFIESTNRASANSLSFNSVFGLNTSPWNLSRNEIANFGLGGNINARNFSNLNIHDNVNITNGSDLYNNIAIVGGSNNNITCNPVILGGKSAISINSSNNLGIQCNQVVGGDNALVINNLCDDSRIKSNNLDAQSSYSMVYATSPSFYTLTGGQAHHGNCFTGPLINDKLVKHGYQDEKIVLFSQFLVSEQPSCHDPQEEAITIDWIKGNFGIDYSCPIGQCSSMVEGPYDESLHQNIISSNLGTHPFINEINYTLKNHLYQRLIDSEQIPEPYESFVDSMELSSSGILHSIKKRLSDSLNYTTSEVNVLNNYKSYLAILQDSLAYYFNLDSLNSEDSSHWLNHINYLRAQVAGIETQISNKEEQRNIRQQMAISTCINQLQSYQVQNTMEANEKALLLIYLPKIANSNLELNSSEKNVITAIANQCVLLGGDVVLQARALLLSVGDTTEFHDEILCSANTEQLISAKKLKNIEVLINQQSLIFQNLTNKQISSIRLFNSEGRQIYSKKYSSSNSQTLDLSPSNKLIPGLYFYLVDYSNGEYETDNIFIK